MRVHHQPDGYIADAVADAPELGEPTWLVAAWDSDRAPASTPMGERLVVAGKALRIPGDGLVLSHETLLALVEDLTVFAGFDEVWAFAAPIDPHLENCPVPITSDRRIANDDVGLDAWVRRYRPLIGFGDGAGLQFVRPLPL